MPVYENLFECINSLKNLVRTGWMQHGIPPSMAETVASHSFESAVLAAVLAEELMKNGYNIDVNKTISIALFHDFVECRIGDINLTFSSFIKGKKEEIEKNESKKIFQKHNELKKIYDEWIAFESLESIIAHIADKLSTFLQARRYMNLGYMETKEILKTSEEAVLKLAKKTGIEQLTILLETMMKK